jgi:hypothetical protein
MAQPLDAEAVNRSVFLFDGFIPGEAHFKDGTKQKASFNYNTLFQQMIFQQNGNMGALANTAAIDTVYISSRKFVPVDTVFYEVRLEAARLPLYVHHICDVSQAAPSTPYGGNSQTGAVQRISSYRFGVATPYQLSVPDNYTVTLKDEFLVRPAGQFIHVKNLKQFSALFPGKEKALKAFINQNSTSFSKQADIEKLLVFSIQL